jgi:hypothetical protein
MQKVAEYPLVRVVGGVPVSPQDIELILPLFIIVDDHMQRSRECASQACHTRRVVIITWKTIL